ncbi:MAG: 50S ribosomal protein L35 [Elusimicrobia bacterium RIFOXYA2_FULL_39_19]|nr:MAG: 50S ribosomal protein L35 [Elusimicrobia bacterium RIFOXYA2_FULL_39_19]
MNKLKTHSGAKKRFKITGTGKVKYRKAGQRHLLTGMSGNRGRNLRRTEVLSGPERKTIKMALGNR